MHGRYAPAGRVSPREKRAELPPGAVRSLSLVTRTIHHLPHRAGRFQ